MVKYLVLPVVLAFSLGTASADTLSFSNLLANNHAYAFISTNDSVLGTRFGESLCCGSASGNYDLSPGQTYFLQLEALDTASGATLAAGLSVSFLLSDNSMVFSNGTDSLDTGSANLTYWNAAFGGSATVLSPQPWVTPNQNENPLAETGAPWANTVWANDLNSSPLGSAAWGTQCAQCYVTFSTTIEAPAPEPSTGAFMLICVIALGLQRFRRSRMRRVTAAKAAQ
jgi:hypothetical protein